MLTAASPFLQLFLSFLLVYYSRFMDDSKNGEAIHSDKVETWKSGLYAHTTVQYCCSRLLLSAFWQLSKLNFHLEKLENDTTEWITNWGSELAEWEVEEFESCKLLCTLCNLPIHYLGLSGDLTHTFLKKQSCNFKNMGFIYWDLIQIVLQIWDAQFWVDSSLWNSSDAMLVALLPNFSMSSGLNISRAVR